jgi:acyl-CoA synthetase (AMP-forming)/AMP-acid ligase II
VRGLSGKNIVSLPESFEFIWAFLGCLRAGAVAVPLDFADAEIAFDRVLITEDLTNALYSGTQDR